MAGGARAQQVPSGYEEGLFELRVPRLGTEVLSVLVSPEGQVLLPVLRLLEITGTPHELSDEPAVRLTFARPEGVGLVTVDLAAGTVTRDALPPVSLAPTEVVRTDDEIYLASSRIGQILEAQLELDWSRLSVVLSRELPFPAQERLSIENRREALLARAGYLARPALPHVPFHARTGPGVLEWDLSASDPRNPVAYLNLRGGFGLLGGELVVQGSAGPDGVERGYASYSRVFPNSPWVKQLQVGEVSTGGVVARAMRGVSISNSPRVRNYFFDQILVQPEVPEGWEYEVYQDGQLLGFSDAVSRAPISVPRHYGSTPVEVRMYGPAGQEVVARYEYQIPIALLPSGRAEYSLGVGECRDDACGLFAFGGLQYGVTPWLTVGGGGETLRDSAGTVLNPFVSAVVAPRGGWTAEVQAARNTFTRGSVIYQGREGRFASFNGGVFDPGYGRPSFILPDERRWYAESSLGSRVEGVPLIGSVRLNGRLEGGVSDGGVDRGRFSASTSVYRGFAEVSYERNDYEDGHLVGINTTQLLPGRERSWLAAVPLSAGVQLRDTRLNMLELGTAVQPRPNTFLSVTARWHARSRQPTLSIGYTARLGFARVHSRASLSPSGLPGLSSSVGGAVTFGPRGDVGLTTTGGIGSAGVMGRVFYDRDADGLFGPGDEPADSVEVHVGGRRIRTDSAGEYRTWAVTPYEIIPVAVDTLRSLDFSWVPRESQVLLRPSPHVYNTVDLPLVRTRELVGRLVAAPGVRTVSGVTVVIRNLATGAEQEVRTFSDGEFYLSRQRPGDYELRIAESSLRALRARSDPGVYSFHISAIGDEILFELPPVELHPATP